MVVQSIIENGKPEASPKSDRIENGISKPLPKNDQHENRSQLVFDRTRKHVMTTHRPMPVALSKAEGVYIWDVEGKRYYDFTSCLSTVNIGHRHPNVVNALFDQVNQMTISIRSYHSQVLSEYGEYMSKYFGYDKVITLNSGNEAGENALRVARRWGYVVKKIPANQAKIICAEGNFLGNTLAALSSSSSPYCYEGYGPYMPGFELVPYNDLVALEEKITDPCACAFVVESIQAHHGVKVPDPGYLRGVRELCTNYNCLMVVDEAATGLGRTGKLLACHHENVRPDIVCLAKSLGGGMYPVSAVLADNHIMAPSYPGELGSTYGGNPLACRIAMAVLQTIHDENLSQRAEIMGDFLRKEMRKLPKEIVKLVRGRGLLNAIVLHQGYSNRDICMKLQENGLLAEVNTSNVIRLSPPLNITMEQILDCIDIIHNTFQSIANSSLIISENGQC